MLRLETKLDKVDRFSKKATDGLVASGVNGTFVALSGDEFDLPSAGDLGVFQIFTESYRDGTSGKWSTDVEAYGENVLTAIGGKYRGLTDQFVGTPAVGDKLKVDGDGKLTNSSVNSNMAVAVCTKAPHNHEHLDSTKSVIGFVTV